MVVLGAYDLTRGAADSLGIGVHVHPMIDFDRFLFFGQTPTEWLQARLYEPGVVNWWDVAFTLVYTSYFIVPFAVAGILWARDRLAFLRFTRRLVSLALAGVATYIVFPAAPPWMAAETGLLDGVYRTTSEGWGVIGVGTAGLFSKGQIERQSGRRRPLAPRRLHRAGGDVPLEPRPAAPAPAAGALSAGDGVHPDRHRRALLLRRPARLALRRRRDGRMGLVGTAASSECELAS